MRLVLLSLFSREDNAGGLAVYDLDSSKVRYVHLIDFAALPGRLRHVRGVHWLGDTLYAVSPFALFLFRPAPGRNGPGLVLEKTVLLPEWLLGPRQQGNLHAVHVSSETRTLHVSFNSLGALDSFDLQGNFKGRKHLWDMFPEYFPLPGRVPEKKTFRFGVIRHMLEDQEHGLVLFTSFVNETERGALLGAGSGRVLLETPFNPHGGIVHEGVLFLTDIQAGLVHAQAWPGRPLAGPFKPAATFQPVADTTRWPGSVQNVRGITVLQDRLVCGVCSFGKIKPTQIPPRLVEFDLKTGEQKAEHFLPHCVGLRRAQVYAVQPVPPWLGDSVATWDEPRYYLHTHVFDPTPIVETNVKPKKNSSRQQVEAPRSTPKSAGRASKPAPQQADSDSLENVAAKPQEGGSILPEITSDAPKNDSPEEKTDNPIEPEKAASPSRPPCIVFDHVSLCFQQTGRIFSWLRDRGNDNTTFWALRDVSFVLHEGETIGIIGRNGSGKSTLSMVCCGVFKPDMGQVHTKGRVQLLAIGVGFKPELTGRENVYVSASLLGLSRKQTRDLMPNIEEFAEIGQFMDQPVRAYSSGMKSKLGFAVATAVEPEILILDEAMAVGDKSFQDKAMARMRAMREKAKSVLIVSHSPGQLKKLCSRVLWLEQGRLLMDDEPGRVVHAYNNFSKNPQKWLERHGEII
ncbi:MAG TPA: ATP-binding cassette domain-containing protein [Desulfonatronum sp.]|nr:ATP-binding cassette domain-containing protein [Desulfonatronum sp.]